MNLLDTWPAYQTPLLGQAYSLVDVSTRHCYHADTYQILQMNLLDISPEDQTLRLLPDLVNEAVRHPASITDILTWTLT